MYVYTCICVCACECVHYNVYIYMYLLIYFFRHIHLELCRIARNINAFFGIQITVQMICSFVFLSGLFYIQYHVMLCLEEKFYSVENKLTILIHTNLWCGIYLTKLITLNYICESVSAKVNF